MGLQPLVGPFDLVVRARSIHSIGMSAAVRWAALDVDGRVIRIGVLAPGRITVVPRARVFLEQPVDRSGPGIGDRLGVAVQ